MIVEPSRYEMREKPRTNGNPREFGVFDTFRQEFVWGEDYQAPLAAVKAAGRYNAAYNHV